MNRSEERPDSFVERPENPRDTGGTKVYRNQMLNSEAAMFEFAESRWYKEVLPGGSEQFEAFTFFNDISDDGDKWRVSTQTITALLNDEYFVGCHIRALVYWMNACGFSVMQCKFIKQRNLGERNLAFNPRVAKFVYSVYLFSKAPQEAPTEVIVAYRALRSVVCVFLSAYGFYGTYEGKIYPRKYVSPQLLMLSAGIGGANLYESLASIGQAPPITIEDTRGISVDLARYVASDARIYSGPDVPDVPDNPNEPEAHGGKTEGTPWWIFVGGLLVVLTLGFLFARMMR